MEYLDVPLEKRVLVDEIYKQARKNFQRRAFMQKHVGDTMQIDLIEMTEYQKQNKGFKYALMAIDCFSKRGFARPLKSKNTTEVTEAMKSIFQEYGIIPKNVQVIQLVISYNVSSYLIFYLFSSRVIWGKNLHRKYFSPT